MEFRALLGHPDVAAARAAIVASDEGTLAEQLRIVAIPAPPFAEEVRGDYLESRFAALGLASVGRDAIGNVVARLPGSPANGSPALIVSAHLDTVFPAGTETNPRMVGRRIFAPGITDNSRGLAALLAVAASLASSKVRTHRPVWFVATVGEEGIGDLRGTKHLFSDRFVGGEIGSFISLDGSGFRRIVHRAIGARRLRISISGAGGHSWSDWGAPNPVHAMGSAIARLTQLPLGEEPRTTLTVARVAGGTSVNSIPEQAWLEIDLRSESMQSLTRLEVEVHTTLEDAVARENAARRRGSGKQRVRCETIGDRPAGDLAADAPLVAAAAAATRAVGARAELAASSTDSNVPLALGIPAFTIGAGGESGGVHTLDEWYSNEGGARGLDRALLTVLAAADVA